MSDKKTNTADKQDLLITTLIKNKIIFDESLSEIEKTAFAKQLIHHFSSFNYKVDSQNYKYKLNDNYSETLFITAIARNTASAYKQKNGGNNISITKENIDEVIKNMKELGVHAFIGADAYTFSDGFERTTNYKHAQDYCQIIDTLKNLTDIKGNYKQKKMAKKNRDTIKHDSELQILQTLITSVLKVYYDNITNLSNINFSSFKTNTEQNLMALAYIANDIIKKLPSDSTIKDLLNNKFTTVTGSKEEKSQAFIDACKPTGSLGDLLETNNECKKLLLTMKKDAEALQKNNPLITAFKKTTQKPMNIEETSTNPTPPPIKSKPSNH